MVNFEVGTFIEIHVICGIVWVEESWNRMVMLYVSG